MDTAEPQENPASPANPTVTRHTLELREADHRIKNHLQFLASYARTAARRPGMTPELLADEVAARLAVIAEVHNMLHATSPGAASPARPFLLRLTEILRQVGARVDVVCVEDIELLGWQLAPSGMFVLEAATNSLKHAADSPEACEVRISLVRDDGGLRLSVADQGRGFAASTEGSGMRLLAEFARRLRGALHYRGGPSGGAVVSLIFPTRSSPADPMDRSSASV